MSEDSQDEGPIGAINEKLKAEWGSKPEHAEFEARHKLEYGEAPVTPQDVAKSAPQDPRQAQLEALGAPASSGQSAAETQVIAKFQAEMGPAGYAEFYQNASAGLAGFQTFEKAEAAMLESGIDPNDPEDVEDAYRFLAKRGAKLRRRR